MDDPVIYFSAMEGGSPTKGDQHARMTFVADMGPVDVVMPLAALPTAAMLFLQIAAAGGHRVAAAPEGFMLDPQPNGGFRLSFAVGNGDVPFFLDRGQVAELRLLLEAALV